MAIADVATEYDIINLGCGTDQRADELNVDAAKECHPDVVLDLEESAWDLPSHAFSHARAYHVLEHLENPQSALEECARILRPGGTLEVRVPIGLDARADPTHTNEWTWRTPEMLIGKQHWHDDIPLTVVERDVELWSHLPGHIGGVHCRILNWMLRRHGAGPWCFALGGCSGEFTVVFEQSGGELRV